jgi:hypothetical protein
MSGKMTGIIGRAEDAIIRLATAVQQPSDCLLPGPGGDGLCLGILIVLHASRLWVNRTECSVVSKSPTFQVARSWECLTRSRTEFQSALGRLLDGYGHLYLSIPLSRTIAC